MPRSVRAYHFLQTNCRLRYDDNRKVRVGVTLSPKVRNPDFPPLLALCLRGMHGCRDLVDAVLNAPGPVLCRTLHSGEIIECDDKLVSRYRKCLAKRNITAILRRFAVDCVERLIPRWEKLTENDPTLREAVRCARQCLRSRTFENRKICQHKKETSGFYEFKETHPDIFARFDKSDRPVWAIQDMLLATRCMLSVVRAETWTESTSACVSSVLTHSALAGEVRDYAWHRRHLRSMLPPELR